MDIKKKYFDLIKQRIDDVYEHNAEKMKVVAKLFGECMENKGVVQLVGFRHSEQFVNELNYRAGGIAPYHALKLRDLVLNGKYDQAKIDSGEVYSDLSVVDLFFGHYQMDDRDVFCLVSFYGDEPVLEEIAKRAKAKGQKVVVVLNSKSNRGNLLNYADEWLDMCADEPDIAQFIDGNPVGQLSSTSTNVMAQMLTAELYNYYVSNGKEAPVLLSANVKGADIHNNSLTDPYERRVR